MSFLYRQSTGILTHNGITLGVGYSGHGEGVNAPTMQDVSMTGPIPQGSYKIQPQETNPKLGPVAMRLEAFPTNQMFGRDGFFIHGDNSKGDRSASEGCIIMDRKVRGIVAACVAAGDNILEVVV